MINIVMRVNYGKSNALGTRGTPLASIVHTKGNWRTNVVSPEPKAALLARLLAIWIHETRSVRLNELIDRASELETVGHPSHAVLNGEGRIACLRACRSPSRGRLVAKISMDCPNQLLSVVHLLAEMGIAADIGRFGSRTQYVTLHDFGSKDQMVQGVTADTMRAAGLGPV